IALQVRGDLRTFRPRGARLRIDHRYLLPRALPRGGRGPPAGSARTAPDHLPARAPAVSCRRRSCWLSGSLVAKQAAYRGGKLIPYGPPLGKRPVSASGQGIDASAPSGIGGDPPAGQQAGLLEAVQRRIDCAFGKVECLIAPAANFLDDRVAMRRAGGQSR